MSTSDEPGEDISFAVACRALESARREVVRATACWVTWARQTGRAIAENDGRAACDMAWAQWRQVYIAVEQAEDALGDAHRQLTAAHCPGCSVPVITGARIYDTDGTPHSCGIDPAGSHDRHS